MAMGETGPTIRKQNSNSKVTNCDKNKVDESDEFPKKSPIHEGKCENLLQQIAVEIKTVVKGA